MADKLSIMAIGRRPTLLRPPLRRWSRSLNNGPRRYSPPIGTRNLGDKLQVIAGQAPHYLYLFDLLANRVLAKLERRTSRSTTPTVD